MLFHQTLISHWAVLLNKKYVGAFVLLCCGTSICKSPLLHQLIEPWEQVRADVSLELLAAGHQNLSFLHNGCNYLVFNSMALYCVRLVLALYLSLQLFNPPLNCVWNSEAMLHGSLYPCNSRDIQGRSTRHREMNAKPTWNWKLFKFYGVQHMANLFRVSGQDEGLAVK